MGELADNDGTHPISTSAYDVVVIAKQM